MKDVTISLKLTDVKLTTAVGFVTRQAGLSWTMRDGVVLVGEREAIRPPMTTCVLDVMPFLALPPDFEGPDIRMWAPQSDEKEPLLDWNDEPDQEKDGVKSRQEILEELAVIVKDVLEADTWEASSFP